MQEKITKYNIENILWLNQEESFDTRESYVGDLFSVKYFSEKFTKYHLREQNNCSLLELSSRSVIEKEHVIEIYNIIKKYSQNYLNKRQNYIPKSIKYSTTKNLLECLSDSDDFWYRELVLSTEYLCQIEVSTANFKKDDKVLYSVKINLLENKNHCENNITLTEIIDDFSNKNHILAPPVNTSFLYTIVKNPNGTLTFSRLDGVKEELKEENYTKETIKKLKRLVVDMKKEIPNGRIGILDGPPGTGKTYLVQSLLSQFYDEDSCSCIYVPSSYIEEICKPEFLTALIIEKSNLFNDSRIVLIIEDADVLMKDREINNNNVANLSNILNMSDGILGKSLDLFIIMTSNIQIEKIDGAITRAGRLSELIHVDKFKTKENFKQIKTIIKNSLKDKKIKIDDEEIINNLISSKEEWSLADCYSAHRDL